nr:hypothetical protein [Tanacetum cinerariifolium]
MASQDTRFSKFEADFKQQHNEMTNKIHTILKAIPDRIVGPLPSDTVKNLKLNVNSTSLVLFVHSYPTVDPQCSSHPSTSINAITTYTKEENNSLTSQLQTGVGTGTQQAKKPKPTLEDEFQDLHINLPVLEVLAHALIYKAMLDNYVKSLELGKMDQHLSKKNGEILGAIPINLKSNMWESKDLINNPIKWNKPPKMEMKRGMPRSN